MGLQIVGAAIATLEPIERNKIARGLDYVGYVPGLGSIGGIVRVIGAIAALIFFSIKASQANGQEKERLLIWVSNSKDEAVRGLLEITWIFNVIVSSIAVCGMDNEPGYQRLDDEAYLKQKNLYLPVQAIIPVESCLDIARGNFIYKDTSKRSEGIHYSNHNYSTLQVIWKSEMSVNGLFFGTKGIVLKEGYGAKPHPTEIATYIVEKQSTGQGTTVSIEQSNA